MIIVIAPIDLLPPKDFATNYFNIQQWTRMPEGGHFLAMEKPELLADDITKFVAALLHDTLQRSKEKQGVSQAHSLLLNSCLDEADYILHPRVILGSFYSYSGHYTQEIPKD